MRSSLLLVGVLAASVVLAADDAGRRNELLGIWTLQSADPRWTGFVNFAAEGGFSFYSTVFQEKHLTGDRTDPMQTELALNGKYEVKSGRLVLRLADPLSAEQREFAKVNFGTAGKDGSYQPTVAVTDSLIISAGERRMVFVRQAKAAP